MLFVAFCKDKPGEGLALRMKTRDKHLAFLNGLGAKLRVAGPLLTEDGKMRGSLVIIEADNLEQARATFANDPFAKVGVFASVEVHPFTQVLGAAKIV